MVEQLRRRLLEQAYLFDDPGAYGAGVEDAIEALRPLLLEEASVALGVPA